MKRDLNDSEKNIICLFAEKIPDTERRQQLLKDMANASAEAALEDGSRIIFHIAGYQRPPYEGQRSFGVEGIAFDSDGAELRIDLFADQNYRLLELDIMKIGEANLIDPDWSTLQLV